MEENLFAKQCIRTFTGKYIDVLNPLPEMICIEDIAHALSLQCRFSGHLPVHYSVGQHSVLCCNLASDKDKFAALMHDSSEAYLVDIPRPIKPLITNYKEIENNLMIILSNVFKFDYPLSEGVHFVDNEMLRMEWDNLMIGKKTVDNFIVFSPEQSEKEFLRLFNLYKK